MIYKEIVISVGHFSILFQNKAKQWIFEVFDKRLHAMMAM